MPAPSGGRWHPTQVARVRRIGMLEHLRICSPACQLLEPGDRRQRTSRSTGSVRPRRQGHPRSPFSEVGPRRTPPWRACSSQLARTRSGAQSTVRPTCTRSCRRSITSTAPPVGLRAERRPGTAMRIGVFTLETRRRRRTSKPDISGRLRSRRMMTVEGSFLRGDKKAPRGLPGAKFA